MAGSKGKPKSKPVAAAKVKRSAKKASKSSSAPKAASKTHFKITAQLRRSFMGSRNHKLLVQYVLVLLKAKDANPLMDAEDLIESRNLQNRAIRDKTPRLITAAQQYVNNTDVLENAQQPQVQNSFIHFWIMRYHLVDRNAARQVICSRISTNTDTYDVIKQRLLKRNRVSQCHSMRWLLSAIKRIIQQIEKLTYVGFWKTLVVEERREILGAIFDQHPIWLITKFRKYESGRVNVGSIWAAESADRMKFRSFFRNMFVDMGDLTYIYRIFPAPEDFKQIVFRYWRTFPLQPKIHALQLGDQYQLPSNPSGVLDRSRDDNRFTWNADDVGAGTFVAPAEEA